LQTQIARLNVKRISAQGYVNRFMAQIAFYQHAVKGKWPGSRLLLATVLMVAGCAAVGPDYVAPGIPAPAAWQAEFGGGEDTTAPDPSRLEYWWANLNDPILSELIDLALAQNLDVKQTLSRVREARARRGVSDAERFPTLDLSTDATWSRSGTHAVHESYGGSFDAGWELDLFGGIQRANEAALADLQAEMANLADVLVSLTAETGLNYIDVRTYQARLAVAKANLAAQQETYELIQGRYAVGLSNELALQQARYNLESTRSRIPSLVTGGAAALNRLAVLTGKPPGQLHDKLIAPHPIPVAPITIAVGIPAQALQRRPDIRKAERELAAQTARIGVAEAERYPKIRLSGSIGLEASKLADLFDGGALFWNHGPRVSWNIFDAGAIRNGIKVQEALQEQALIAYEAAVLEAMAEVENAMTAFAQEQLRRSRLTHAVEAAQLAEKISSDKFSAGLINFSDVLDVQRTLLSFQDQLAESDGTVTANLIRLYKALGGGWSPSMLDKGASSP
jgi:NodT family efflux transporter outer membrane factor (OMF) lipoprotein